MRRAIFTAALAATAVSRTAVCVGLPWRWSADMDGISGATLRLDGTTLAIAGGSGSRAAFALDTKTFRVATLHR